MCARREETGEHARVAFLGPGLGRQAFPEQPLAEGSSGHPAGLLTGARTLFSLTAHNHLEPLQILRAELACCDQKREIAASAEEHAESR